MQIFGTLLCMYTDKDCMRCHDSLCDTKQFMKQVQMKPDCVSERASNKENDQNFINELRQADQDRQSKRLKQDKKKNRQRVEHY